MASLTALAGLPPRGAFARPSIPHSLREATMSLLITWGSFYVIVGSSAGALTGLTFVVITLVGETPRRAVEQGIRAFTTPTTLQFGTVLLVCALLSAPWPALAPLAVLLGLCGLVGIGYSSIAVGRQRRLENYTPELEDWLWYAAGPLVGYVALLAAAVLLLSNPAAALFAIAGAALLLLFIGIRNAWDIVTYIASARFTRQNEQNGQNEGEE
jgi:hypothetical protein